MQIIPRHNFVLIKAIRHVSPAGVILPEKAGLGHLKVLAVGPEVEHLEPGDVVLCMDKNGFDPRSQSPDAPQDCLLVLDESLVAVIK